MIAQLARLLRLLQRNRGASADAGNLRDGAARLRGVAVNFIRAHAQHRLEEVNARRANLELREVHPHRDATDTRVDVVTHQRALAAFVELPLRVERERRGRNDRAATDDIEDGRG